MTPKVSSSVFIFLSSSLVILTVIYPWILGVILVFGLLGYSSLDLINENLKEFLQENELFQLKKEADDELETDPLLHIKPIPLCSVCHSENCARDNSDGNQHQCTLQKSSPTKRSPARTPTHNYSTPISISRADLDIKIDVQLDKALSRFCTSVFDYYISNQWAPYQTRRQLKVAFKKLLTSFAQIVKCKVFIENEEGNLSTEKFCREKLIPLFLYHAKDITKYNHSSIGLQEIEQEQARAKLKVRRLCRKVLEKTLVEEDQKCKLWMELCVSVLADGVLWNLIKLGRDQIPLLVEQVVARFKKSLNAESILKPTLVGMETSNLNNPTKEESVETIVEGYDTVDSLKNVGDPLRGPDAVRTEHQSIVPANKGDQGKTPFLMNYFLDPINDIDQPDEISSRWRPKLMDILDERELLYSLIQYLKGHKALEYLQAVLDDSADEKEHCKKVLELEYLPFFCRCSSFLEKLGLSRVDEGIEPQTETNSNGGSRPSSGHTRSASFGGGNSGLQILRFEQGVVDGLPLYQANANSKVVHESTSISGLVFPGPGNPTMEADYGSKRKPPTLETIITNFFSSTLSRMRDPIECLSDRPDALKRAGVDSKTYDDLSHPEVNLSVVLHDCDIFEAATETVTSSITLNPWAGPIITGWLNILHPYLKPHFDTFLEAKLNEFLTLDLFIEIVNLISDAFEEITPDENVDSISKSSTAEMKRDNSMLNSFVKYVVANVVDVQSMVNSLKHNKEAILLFFVDVLDVFVSEISVD